ncbi:helicase-related protein [Planktothricoides raciborskii]|uniref:Helicase-related protein n=1 Tax=Planktothricoides raciborskii GIHE-MW2 TaxID=2792601 RepID=A0AAU8JEK9_9CYAN
MLFKEKSWKLSYSSNEDNPIFDFYIPALECSINYDRKSGFFNSAILSKVAGGLGGLLQNEGKMRLILGCQFQPQDLEAIKKGYELREAMISRLDADLTPPETFAQLKHFEILAWLIQYGYLEIKIAIPLQKDGTPESPEQQLDRHHIFHEKVGIFTDAEYNQLVCFGSNNESLSGWEQNIESFHVYCSWEGDRDMQRVTEEVYRFETLWHDLAPNVKLFAVPEAIRQKLLRYSPGERPSWDEGSVGSVGGEVKSRRGEWPFAPTKEISLFPTPYTLHPTRRRLTPLPPLPPTPHQTDLLNALLKIHEHPGCLDFCLKSIPIKPWLHQIKILRRVAASFPNNFLIADEVGLGKTIETGLILRYLLVSQKVKRVLILVPATVQPQWQEELREKFNLDFWSYRQGSFKSADKITEISANSGNPWNQCDRILASSHLVRRKERQGELLGAEPWDLVILDEAHHARRKNPQARQETPNSLLQLMQQLKTQTKALILLSATPMQIDPIEVFDLLDLLGLNGHWRYGDNFCNYFSTLSSTLSTTLSSKPDEQLLKFWQEMSRDYFQFGGKPCPRFQAYLEKNNRVLAYQLQDTWNRGKPLVHGKKLLENADFMQLSRQYLTVNTPLKDLMFRHTRDTLREYYKRGMLSQDIPQRVVQDNAIALESDREIPLYQAVSDYVRNFYKLAEKQNRKALGFLMTLYRKRLTSSFYAIRESLQRRLEGISITPDDLADLDDADDAVIQGLEQYFNPGLNPGLNPVDPKEIEYLEDLLRQFENTGDDSKLSFLLETLRQELLERESAIIFTQYTDTMDYLREQIRQLYGDRVACYSGRGGELLEGVNSPNNLVKNNQVKYMWRLVPKEQIKRMFRDGEIQVLICTESASEGLNLQTCGVLINYDLPWNPMRVEQRIGRLDRIGQRYPTVKVHNFYYDGTVEAKVYKKLRDRINLFTNVVGHLQPILAQVPTFIEKVVMSADPEEEDVLMAEFDRECDRPFLRPDLDEMVGMDVEADLAEIRQTLPVSPITPAEIEQLFTQSEIMAELLRSRGIVFTPIGDKIWQLTYQNQEISVTFYPEVFDEHPSLRLMTLGDQLFEELLVIGC